MTRRTPTGEALDALAEARVVTGLIRDSRTHARHLADRRRRLVLAANLGGASYGAIATALGISVGNVQQLVNAARTDGTGEQHKAAS